MSEENNKKNSKSKQAKPEGDANKSETQDIVVSNSSQSEKDEAAISDKNNESDSNGVKESKENSANEKKEGLKESEIIDINSSTDKSANTGDKKESTMAGVISANKGKNKKSTTADFIKAEKKRKTRRRIIFIAVILIVGVVICYKINQNAKEAEKQIAMARSSNIQTAAVEKKVIKNTVTATGTIQSNETRTLSTILKSGTKITEVNAEIGDYVNEGDVLVRFSTEDISKQISEAKEDISTQKQQDSIDAEDSARNYIYSYTSTASSLKSAARSVDTALEELHEACNAYGDAKRKLQEAKDAGAGSASSNELQEQLDSSYNSKITQLEAEVTQAYQAQQSAQTKYDEAVENEAKSIADQQNGLSDADSKYKQSTLQAGSQVKTMERNLEDLEDSLENYEVTAPISGVVTAVNVSQGNSFQSGEVLTIQDMSSYNIELSVSEYDIAKVRSAYETAKANNENLNVVIKTEVTEEREFAGHVVSIAPTSTSTTKGNSSDSSSMSSSLSSSSSSSSYSVKVVIDEVDESFMVGMSAKAAIVVEQSPDNAFAVPYNAVYEDEDNAGSYYVKVVSKSPSDIPEMDSDDVDSMITKEGIVVENSTTKSGANKRPSAPGGVGGPSSGGGNAVSRLFSNFNTAKNVDQAIAEAKNTEMDTKKVKVKKVFETDYYTAIIPENPADLSENDEVVLAVEETQDNMFGMMGMF